MSDFVIDRTNLNIIHIRQTGTRQTLCGVTRTSTWTELPKGRYNPLQSFCDQCTLVEDQNLPPRS